MSDINEIYHNLWQGSRPSSNHIGFQKFDVIVFCEDAFQPSAEDINRYFGGVKSLFCPFEDNPNVALSEEVFQNIHKTADKVCTLLKQNKKVLVVCFAGLNRSGLVCALSLSKYLGMSGKAAMNSVKSRRPNALHNKLFCQYLLELK